MLKNKRLFWLLWVLLLATNAKAQSGNCSRIYVDSAVTISGNGNSWATALKTVSQALDSAHKGNCSSREIWVRKGTYYPMQSATAVAIDQDSSFRILRNGIKIYGGFAGGETALSARNLTTNLTVLSGAVGGNGNLRHVVTVVSNNTIDTSTCIDGFTIRDGAAYGGSPITIAGKAINRSNGGGIYNAFSSPSIRNCTFSFSTCGAFGAGIYSEFCSPLIKNCTFSYNNAFPNHGGGMCNSNASPTVTNCVFAFNTCSNGTTPSGSGIGGGMYNIGGSPIISNCLFYANTTSGPGGGIGNSGSTPTISNCTFVSNSNGYGGLINNFNGSLPSFTNCVFWGNTSGGVVNEISNQPNSTNPSAYTITYSNTQTPQSGTGNSTANPLFVNAANAIGPDGLWGTSDDGLRLANCSPAINTGSNAAIPAGITTDITGDSRIQNAIVDRGAYEMPATAFGASSTTIARSLANPVCPTASIIFTATTLAPGTVPAYQWFKNGVAVGSNQTTYSSNSWSNGDSVWVVYTNNNCSTTDTSNRMIVQVVAQPATPVGPAAVCGGSAGNGYSVAAVPGVTVYTWSVPAGWVITAGQGTTAITVTAAAGSTSGSVSVSTGSGCSGSMLTVSGGSVAPSVLVGSNSGTNICSGTLVTFTAVATNGGSAPGYQWKKNGVNVGTNSATYSTTSLANGDVVTATLTSSIACVSPATVTATGPAITVTPSVVPAISIAGGSPVALCVGSSNTFMASNSNSGGSPTYQWYKNGIAIAGATGTSYTGSAFSNNDSVSVVLTSTATCRSVDTVRSAWVQVNVYLNVAPTVIVGSNSGSTVCAGALVTFTAAITNNGTTQSFQWKKNGVNVGTNSATYSTTALANGDVVTVTLVSSSPCAAASSVTATGPPITVVNAVVPAVSISGPSAITLCTSSSYTFTASSTNGGVAPGYKWYKNGVLIPGANAATYTGSNFSTNDVITVLLTSAATCRSVDTVRSGSVVLTIAPNVVLVLTVTANPGTSVPAGSSVTFTATVSAGNTSATYQWYKNGLSIAGATGSIYTTTTLQGGDLINVRVSALGPCANPNNLVSVPLRISDPAGIQNVSGTGNWQESIVLHPNPNSGQFTVSADWGTLSAGEKVQVSIVNGLGQVVYSTEIIPTAGKWRLEVQLNEGVANGLYTLKINRQQDGSRAALPVVIQR